MANLSPSSRDLGELSMNASEDATKWLSDATSLIDDSLGNGTSRRFPELVVAFMQAAAMSYHAERLVDAAEMIASAIREQQERTDHD